MNINMVNDNMGKMTVNGVEFSVPPGASVSIVNGQVLINGVEAANYPQPATVRVIITGDVNVLRSAGAVEVTGNVGAYVKANGSVEVKGSVKGTVDAGGSVTCGDVGGDVDAGGSVRCGKVAGSVDAGGSVRHG